MLEKGDLYSGTLYDNNLNLNSNSNFNPTSNSSTATTTLSSYYHKKRRLDHVIGELNSEYANQVGDISSTTSSSSRQNFSDSVHLLGLNHNQSHTNSTNFDNNSYNGQSSIPSSPTNNRGLPQTVLTSSGNQQNFIRASTIKLLDTYQVFITYYYYFSFIIILVLLQN